MLILLLVIRNDLQGLFGDVYRKLSLAHKTAWAVTFAYVVALLYIRIILLIYIFKFLLQAKSERKFTLK